MSESNGDELTLEQAQFMVWGGAEFGDVFSRVDANERHALKEWYVRDAGVPVRKTISPTEDLLSIRDLGYTGDACSNCGSMMMKRTGPCLTCEECGSTSGGCG